MVKYVKVAFSAAPRLPKDKLHRLSELNLLLQWNVWAENTLADIKLKILVSWVR